MAESDSPGRTHALTTQRRLVPDAMQLPDAGLAALLSDREWTAPGTMCGTASPGIAGSTYNG